MTTCLDSKDYTGTTCLNYLVARAPHHLLIALPGVSELKLGVDNGILRHGYCHLELLMRIDSHNQIPGWYLAELACCVVFHRWLLFC